MQRMLVQEMSTHDQLFFVRFNTLACIVVLGPAPCQFGFSSHWDRDNVRKGMHGALPIKSSV